MQVFEVGGSWGSHFHAILHKHPATWQQITCNGWSHLKKNRWCLVLERLATPPAPGVAARNPKEPVLFHLFQITMVRLLPGALWCIHLAASWPWLLYYFTGHLWRSTVRGPWLPCLWMLSWRAFGPQNSDFLHLRPWVTMGYTSMVPAKEPLRYWVPLWLSCIAATFSDHPNPCPIHREAW